ncbi:MAG: lytic murein transglycosylase B [Pseudomonadota bacterium]
MKFLQHLKPSSLLPALLALALAAAPLAHGAPDKAAVKSGAKPGAKAGAKAGAKSGAKARPQAKAKAGRLARNAPKTKAQAKAIAHAKRNAAAKAAAVDYKGERVGFGEWQAVKEFADLMSKRHGFEREALRALIAQIHFVDSAVQLVKPAPPGKPKNWQAYSALMIEPTRIKAGTAFWNENAATLARAEQAYGVPAEIIVGIIGIETIYGRNTGRFRVLDTLTTLGFAYPETPNKEARMTFFRGELEAALLLARERGIDPLSLLGSFAGAIGLPQFMPGSVLAWGVDFDVDGVVDLHNSRADAIGSVANFLVQHGWKRDQAGALAYPVDVAPSMAWEKFIGQGLAAKYGQQELREAGIASGQPLPPGMLFGLVDLQNGPEATEYWLATDNFYAITQYNRSFFYAMSVIELGRAVRRDREN